MIMSFNKQQLKEILEMPENLEPVLVLALGKPCEEVCIVDMEDDDVKYYRDENQVHYVPKRSFDSIMFCWAKKPRHLIQPLGLAQGASEEDIKKAHRKLIIENHPDKPGRMNESSQG